MAANVRIDIQDYKIARAAVEHKIRFIVFGVGFELTKNAAVSFRFSGAT